MARRAIADTASRTLQLIIGQTFLDDLEVWLFDGEQSLGPLYSGAKRPFAERGEPYPQFLLNLPRLGDGPHSLLLRVQSHSAINLPLQVVGAAQWRSLLAQLDAQAGTISCECQLYYLQQRPRWVYLSLHRRPHQDLIEGIVVDLSERRALEERLQQLAARDALTGLLNLGIDYAQGYFVGRPQPLRQLADDAYQYTQADR